MSEIISGEELNISGLHLQSKFGESIGSLLILQIYKFFIKCLSACCSTILQKAEMGLLDNYKLKLNLRAAEIYEKLTNRSYFKIYGVDDMIFLAYAILVANNDIDFTFETFVKMLEQKKVANEVVSVMNRMVECQAQYKGDNGEREEGDNEENVKEPRIMDFIKYLIVSNHLDPHFVLYDMEMWELGDYINACNDRRKDELVEKRLFSFLEMSPLRLPKNCKGPDDILPFTWEAEEKKKKQEEELAIQTKAALGLLLKNKKVKEEDNGEG